MTTPVYVRSTDGSSGDNGSTWALAKDTLTNALAVDEAGGTIFVSNAHSESTNAALTLTFAGTNAAPMKILCANDAAEPPTSLALTGVVATGSGSAYHITINGAVYVYGLTFKPGGGGVGSGCNIVLNSTSGPFPQTYEKCIFNLDGISTANRIIAGNTGVEGSTVTLKDCDFKFRDGAQGINCYQGKLVINGGSVLSGSAALTSGFYITPGTSRGADVEISGVDLQNIGTAAPIFGVGAGTQNKAVIRNCRLPASWSGSLTTGTKKIGERYEMYNCDSVDTNYNLWIEDYYGSIVDNTSVYNDAGADDGSAMGFSWLMTASANAGFPHMTLRSPEIVKWNETVTGTITATVEIVHNSAGGGTNGALLNTEIWLEVMYLSTSGVPLGSWISDRCGNMNLNSDAADQASSTAAWTGDSAGWDTQKLSVSFDPKEKGYIHAIVHLAKASAAVYVDPLLTLA